MTETMNDYKDEIERSFRKVKEGDILEGTVIDVSDTAVTWISSITHRV